MRKLIEFDDETMNALKLLASDRMSTFQELADEAFADLLKKHGRPTSLKAALKASLKAAPPRGAKPSPAPKARPAAKLPAKTRSKAR